MQIVVFYVNVITGELQHNLVIVDIDKKQKKNTELKPGSQQRNVAKITRKPYRQIFEYRVKKLCLTPIMIYGDLLKKVC